MKIYDKDEEVYQVPESVLSRAKNEKGTKKKSALKFDYKKEPFSFKVSRGDEVLFDTSASNLIFQSQYLNLRTWLPKDPNLYGLGEHSDALRLGTENYTRTMWNRDAYGIPSHTNLYGTHPVYYDHRGKSGTHAVFLLNSNGMDIKIDRTKDDKQYLEYNIVGGVFDFYFLAGPTPKKASAQYAGVVGRPAMQSYWTFGVGTQPFRTCDQLTNESSSTNADTATGMLMTLPKLLPTIARQISPWRPCGPTSITWIRGGSLLLTQRGFRARRCASWCHISMTMTRNTLSWLTRL